MHFYGPHCLLLEKACSSDKSKTWNMRDMCTDTQTCNSQSTYILWCTYFLICLFPCFFLHFCHSLNYIRLLLCLTLWLSVIFLFKVNVEGSVMGFCEKRISLDCIGGMPYSCHPIEQRMGWASFKLFASPYCHVRFPAVMSIGSVYFSALHTF